MHIVTYQEAAQQAKKTIAKEAAGDQLGLLTRWPHINVALMKYARFKAIYTFAGASGSGKSFLINQLRTDFSSFEEVEIPFYTENAKLIEHIETNSPLRYDGDSLIVPSINKSFPHRVLTLFFTFEMSPDKEVARTLCDLSGFNYKYIHSSSGTKTKDGSYTYNKLNPDEQRYLNTILDYLGETKNVFFLPKSVSASKIYEIVEDSYNKFCRDTSKPTQLVVMLDHTLLVEKEDENNDLEVVNSISKTAINLREQLGCLVILASQFNNEIEDDRRRSKPALHYPTKKDIYCGGQLFQASDFVFTQFMPSKLGISKYGPREMDTRNLIHLGLIKSRFDNDGQLWLNNSLHVGKILPAYANYNEKGKFANWNIGTNLNEEWKINQQK